MKREVRIAISVIAGVAAAVVALVYVSSVRSEAQTAQQEALARFGGETAAVCVATRDIEPGEAFDDSNVALEEWASSLLPDDAVTSLADVVGKVATSQVPERAVLSPLYWKTQTDALDVPEGMVAVCVASDPAHAVGGALARGDDVDVYVSKDGIADRLTAARVLDTSSLASGGGDLGWVTLAVLPSCVEELIASAAQAQVNLVMPGAAATETDKGAEGDSSRDTSDDTKSRGEPGGRVDEGDGGEDAAQIGDSKKAEAEDGQKGEA